MKSGGLSGPADAIGRKRGLRVEDGCRVPSAFLNGRYQMPAKGAAASRSASTVVWRMGTGDGVSGVEVPCRGCRDRNRLADPYS